MKIKLNNEIILRKKDKIGNLFIIIAGQSADKKNLNNKNIGIPFHQGNTCFSNKYLMALNCNNFIEEKLSKKTVDENTILLSVRAPVGELNITKQKISIGRGLTGLILKNGNKNYGYYLLKLYRDKIKSFGRGSTFEGLTISDLKNIDIDYIDSIDEQNKIVKILEKQELIISNIEKLISKTEKMFEYFCDREFDLKDIEKSNYQIKDIIIRNPKSTIKAGDIKESTGNIPAFNSSAKLQYFYDDYLVDGENIFLPDGGQSSIHYLEGKAAYSSHVLSFKLKKEVMTKYFYFYFKNNKDLLDSMFQGAALKNLNKKYFFDYQIEVPSLGKQKETVELLEKQERLIENQKKLLEKEKQKFEWLSEKLLSGEYLVVEEEQ